MRKKLIEFIHKPNFIFTISIFGVYILSVFAILFLYPILVKHAFFKDPSVLYCKPTDFYKYALICWTIQGLILMQLLIKLYYSDFKVSKIKHKFLDKLISNREDKNGFYYLCIIVISVVCLFLTVFPFFCFYARTEVAETGIRIYDRENHLIQLIKFDKVEKVEVKPDVQHTRRGAIFNILYKIYSDDTYYPCVIDTGSGCFAGDKYDTIIFIDDKIGDKVPKKVYSYVSASNYTLDKETQEKLNDLFTGNDIEPSTKKHSYWNETTFSMYEQTTKPPPTSRKSK